MLGIILNETELVNKIIKDNEMPCNTINAIKILIKYYCIKGETDVDRIKGKIIHVLEEADPTFIRSVWNLTIKELIIHYIKYAKKYKENLKMINIDEITVTKNELDNINQLEDKKARKVAFILLVYAKIDNIIHSKYDGWVNQNLTDIFKEAKVYARGFENIQELHKLKMNNYITTSYNGKKLNMVINYMDNNSEVAITIDDFSGVIYYYLNYMGENWKKCSVCGRWVKMKSINSKQKYCNACAKNENIINTKNNKKSLKNSEN